jgi:NitT/TauT family transport system ATP-binding protein
VTPGDGPGRVAASALTVEFPIARHGRVKALAPIDLELAPGSFTALVGPSGCGKSTLLNVVGGFVAPTSGNVLLDGRPIAGPTPDVGVVFQQYALFPWFSAVGNVEFALKRFRLAREARRREALGLLDEVGLAGRGESFPQQLSGGMKQRVALARTFAGKPRVLLMDEPFGALDAQTRRAMHELLLRVWEHRRTTVLFITHDVDEALILADRVHVMSSAPGRIIDTVEVNRPRPRSVDNLDEEFLRSRARIIRLLRDQDTGDTPPPPDVSTMRRHPTEVG